MKLSVPYNQQPDLLDALEPLAPHISFLYLPFHPAVALSARTFTGTRDAQRYARDLDAVARWCARADLGMNLVANAPHWAVDAKGVARELERLRGLVAPLKVTFADLLAARAVRKLAPWVELSVSCLADVQTPVQALMWKEQAGATHLVVSREVNRRPDKLAALARTGMTLGVVSFDDCVPGCQARSCHFRPAPKGAAFSGKCDPGSSAIRRSQPWKLAQKELLPAHLRRLEGVIGEVKIAGRDVSTHEVLRRAMLYLEGRSLEHPNGYYREPASAWKKIASCDRECARCGWCEENLDWAPLTEGGGEGARPRPAHEVRVPTPEGGSVRLWLEPVGERQPLRAVAGWGICYASGDAAQPVVDALVARVARALERSGAPIRPERLRPILKDAGLLR